MDKEITTLTPNKQESPKAKLSHKLLSINISKLTLTLKFNKMQMMWIVHKSNHTKWKH